MFKLIFILKICFMSVICYLKTNVFFLNEFGDFIFLTQPTLELIRKCVFADDNVSLFKHILLT